MFKIAINGGPVWWGQSMWFMNHSVDWRLHQNLIIVTLCSLFSYSCNFSEIVLRVKVDVNSDTFHCIQIFISFFKHSFSCYKTTCQWNFLDSRQWDFFIQNIKTKWKINIHVTKRPYKKTCLCELACCGFARQKNRIRTIITNVCLFSLK